MINRIVLKINLKKSLILLKSLIKKNILIKKKNQQKELKLFKDKKLLISEIEKLIFWIQI